MEPKVLAAMETMMRWYRWKPVNRRNAISEWTRMMMIQHLEVTKEIFRLKVHLDLQKKIYPSSSMETLLWNAIPFEIPILVFFYLLLAGPLHWIPIVR